jgi:hypothetical protein
VRSSHALCLYKRTTSSSPSESECSMIATAFALCTNHQPRAVLRVDWQRLQPVVRLGVGPAAFGGQLASEWCLDVACSRCSDHCAVQTTATRTHAVVARSSEPGAARAAIASCPERCARHRPLAELGVTEARTTSARLLARLSASLAWVAGGVNFSYRLQAVRGKWVANERSEVDADGALAHSPSVAFTAGDCLLPVGWYSKCVGTLARSVTSGYCLVARVGGYCRGG